MSWYLLWCKGLVLLIVLVVLCFWYVSCYFFWLHFFRVYCVSLEFCFFYKYEDDEGDKVVLATDGDLSGAVNHARSMGLKVVNLVKVFNFHAPFLVLFFCDFMFFLLFLNFLGSPNVCCSFICATLPLWQIVHNIKGHFLNTRHNCTNKSNVLKDTLITKVKELNRRVFSFR